MQSVVIRVWLSDRRRREACEDQEHGEPAEKGSIGEDHA